MALTSYNDFISRISNEYWLSQPIWDEIQTAIVALGGNLATIGRLGISKTLPNPLPSGVTAYIPTRVTASCSTVTLTLLVAKLINMGSLDIATPAFTDGSAMPTVTELGVSRQIASPILIEVTTGLNATPGSITVTYVDQDGNAPETTAVQALGASAPIKSSSWAMLNSPDWGAEDITAATRTGGTTPTGVIRFWGLVPIAMFPVSYAVAQIATIENLLTSGFNPVRLGAGDLVGAFSIGSLAVRAVVGDIFFVGDN